MSSYLPSRTYAGSVVLPFDHLLLAFGQTAHAAGNLLSYAAGAGFCFIPPSPALLRES